MSSWRTLFGGGPCSALSPIVATDPGRKNVWRFEAQDALVGYRWNGSAWAAEWRAPCRSVHPQGLFAYYNSDDEEIMVGTVNEGTSKLTLRRLSAPRDAQVFELPQLSDFAGLPGLDDEGDLRCSTAVHVPDFGTLIHLTPVESAGFTFHVDGESLVQVCRGPALESLVYDEDHGIVAAAESVFTFNGKYWEDLDCKVDSGLAVFPGHGPVALREDEDRCELITVPGAESLGAAGTLPCRVLVPFADEPALLMLGGALASSQTHIWRAGVVETTPGLQGCAPSQVFSSPKGVLASDAATRAVYLLEGRTWNLVKMPLPDAHIIEALTMSDEGDAFAMTRDGDLLVSAAGESQWNSFGGIDDVAIDDVLHLAWDERSSRLIIQVAEQAWAHDGEILSKLGEPLEETPTNLASTPVGVYGLVRGRLWLLRDEWFQVDMYPVPSSSSSLLFDASHGLLAIGPSASFFLTAHGWERFDGGPGHEAVTFAMDRTTGSLMGFGDSFMSAPPIFVRSVPPGHVHPLPVSQEIVVDVVEESVVRRTEEFGEAAHILQSTTN